MTDRSTVSRAGGGGRRKADPTGADLIASANLSIVGLKSGKGGGGGRSFRSKKRSNPIPDAELLAPPTGVSSSALQSLKLQSELSALLRAADEAAANSATKLVIMKAESAAQDQRHAAALAAATTAAEQQRAEQARTIDQQRAELEAASAGLAATSAENAALKKSLEVKEDEYATELQKWVVDLNSSHSIKLKEAVAAEQARGEKAAEKAAERAAEKAVADERAQWQAKVAELEEQLRQAKAVGGGGESAAELEC